MDMTLVQDAVRLNISWKRMIKFRSGQLDRFALLAVPVKGVSNRPV
ncbi:hypothetical protein [uncultured Bradyrhizobium sp.]